MQTLWKEERRIEDASAIDCEILGVDLSSLDIGDCSGRIVSLRMWKFRKAAKPLGESDEALRRSVGSWSKLPYAASRVDSSSSMMKAVNLGDGRPRL